MKIDHLALYVADLEKEKDFYVKYFCGIATPKYVNPLKHFSSYFCRFEDGSRLEIMKKDDIDSADHSPHLGFAHLAFSVGSASAVSDLTYLLRDAGFTVVSLPRRTGDGYFESSILDPEGNLIEITI